MLQSTGQDTAWTINHRETQKEKATSLLHTLQDVGNGAKQPVKPVENRPIFALWLATEQRDEWLRKQTTHKLSTVNY